MGLSSNDSSITVSLLVDDKAAKKKLEAYSKSLKATGIAATSASIKAAKSGSLAEQQMKETAKAAESYRKKLVSLEKRSATFGLKGTAWIKAQREELQKNRSSRWSVNP